MTVWRKIALNKYNAPEVLSVLTKALEVAGLEDTVKELKIKGFFRLINEAWMHREKMASQAPPRKILAAVSLRTPASLAGEYGVNDHAVILQEGRKGAELVIKGLVKSMSTWDLMMLENEAKQARGGAVWIDAPNIMWGNALQVVREAKKYVVEMYHVK